MIKFFSTLNCFIIIYQTSKSINVTKNYENFANKSTVIYTEKTNKKQNKKTVKKGIKVKKEKKN